MQPRGGPGPSPSSASNIASPSSSGVYDSSASLPTVESVLAPLRYADKPRVARDVLGLIRNTNSLAFKVGVFVQPNGASETLLQILGTTPIYYKSAVYNIPVSIWLLEAYPHRPPTCYVTPTKDMRIKDGHLHVDHYGMIYLPYLNQWHAQNSSLLEMVTMMSSVFSTDPPVFKVPANAAPAPTPAPTATVITSPAMQQQLQQQQQQLHQQQQQQSSQQAHPRPQQQQQQPSYPSQPTYPQHQPPVAAAYPNQPAASQLSLPSQQHHQPHQPHQPQQQSPSPPPVHVQSAADDRGQLKNQLLATLTSKLRQQLQDDLSLKTLLMDDLLQTQAQLEAHERSVVDKMALLASEAAQVDQARQVVLEKNEELTAWLEQHEGRDMVEVDKVAHVKDTWSKQLLENVSLAAALEDAFYLLDRSLADDRIDLQTYTKQIRNLARKQFYAKALVAQIQTHQQQQAANGMQPPQSQQHPQHQHPDGQYHGGYNALAMH